MNQQIELEFQKEQFDITKPFTTTINCGNIKIYKQKEITININNIFFEQFSQSEFEWKIINTNDVKIINKNNPDSQPIESKKIVVFYSSEENN